MSDLMETRQELAKVKAQRDEAVAVCEALHRNKNPFDYETGVYPMGEIYAMAEFVIATTKEDSNGQV